MQEAESQEGNLLLHRMAQYVNLAGELFVLVIGF